MSRNVSVAAMPLKGVRKTAVAIRTRMYCIPTSPAAQRIGFYPPCESMVDKIGWTEPLDSARCGMGFVRCRSWRAAVVKRRWQNCRSRIECPGGLEWRSRSGSDYDRWVREGQRVAYRRALSRRGEKPTRGGDAGVMKCRDHDGGRGGARACGALIGPMTIMRPALQCGHW